MPKDYSIITNQWFDSPGMGIMVNGICIVRKLLPELKIVTSNFY